MEEAGLRDRTAVLRCRRELVWPLWLGGGRLLGIHHWVKPHGRRTVHLAEKVAWAKALGQGRRWCGGGPGRQMLPGRALQEIGLDSEKVALPCSARTFLLPIHGRASCRLCPPAQLAGHLCGWYRQRPGPSWPGRHQAVLTLAPSPQPSWHVAAQPASRPLGTISCLFLPSLGRAWGRLPLLTLESREYGLGEARLGRDRGRQARGYKTIPGTPTACLPWGPGDARMEASTPRATGRGSGVLQTVMRILASWHQTWRPGGFLSPA